MRTVVIVNHDGMGHGDPELGARILRTFFTKASALTGLEAIIFYNSGVLCLTGDDDMLQPLSVLSEDGVDLIACGTCVEALEVSDKIRIGEVGSMDQILTELAAAEKVITL